VRFEILGPTRIRSGSTEVAITARRERILLAMLLLQADRCVEVERLIDAVWDDRPPKGAASQVQAGIYRLRKRLAAIGLSGQVIATESGGYRMRVNVREVDLWEFRRLRDDARKAMANGRPNEARRDYRAALGLWRGEALAGMDGLPLRGVVAGLYEERVQAWEECLHCELVAGSDAELVAELTELVSQHPLREGPHRTLMLAFYRSGRQADALGIYRELRQRLADELGIEPGEDLQELHRAVLSRDPALAAKPSAQPAPEDDRAAVPRELPAAVTSFIGRDAALKTLDEIFAASQGAHHPVPVVISAIAGTAGVGKTALAVQWAHQAADRFPDGQLYVNLRGYDTEQPMNPADALARFLSALGVADQDIPLDSDERAARFRSEVAGRRMLLVLDNAGSVEQVRPLLPGSGTCAVLVTSRDSLTGLIVGHGARRLELDLLPLADAIELLRRLVGSRVDAEPDAAATLADQCARLPLALRVAAELAAACSATSLSLLAVELGDRQRRLQLLDPGDDPYTTVRVVFSWSVDSLPPDAARTFRLLGLHPGPDFGPYATAALAGANLDAARHGLELLTRTHLVHRVGPGRYGMHDLLRAYAIHLISTEDSDTDRRAALCRLFDSYLATAATAMDSLYPAEVHRRPRIPASATPAPELADPDAARSWLDTERPCLVAVAIYTASHGWPAHTVRLSTTLYRYLQSGHYTQALAIHGHAHLAAEQIGDPAGQAYTLRYIGTTHAKLGRLGPAGDHLRRALALFRQVGDQGGEAQALNTIGIAEERLGRYRAATEHHKQALALFRQVGDQGGEAQALANLGNAERRLGRHRSAASYQEQALVLFRNLGEPYGEAHVLNNLGGVEAELGRYRTAIDHHHQALDQFRSLGNLQGEASALDSLGVAHLGLGLPEEAIEYLNQAITRFRDIGDRAGESFALNGLGEAGVVAGRLTAALTHHTAALTIATEIGIRDQQARAHNGLGCIYHALDALPRARAYYEQALALYAELDMPDAEQVRANLAALADAGPTA
jgi:DNA-binding SARP family transcriptional activator/Flp pilus assembly protein TadD